MLVQIKLPEIGVVGGIVSSVVGPTVDVVVAVGHWYCDVRTHRFCPAENIVPDGH